MSEQYQPHPVRGRLNAACFAAFDGVINRAMRRPKEQAFADLPDEVVEIGPGVGANFRFLRPGTRLIAIEPNPHMHARLIARAAVHRIHIELRSVKGERVDLPDASAVAVISSLVLCTVERPAAVVAEVRRILEPGGRYSFVEHVAAPEGTALRRIQHGIRRPWAWAFEGCSCERDTAGTIRAAGFRAVDVTDYCLRSVIVPVNTQIAGTAIA
ncbi:MAG TPA: methyltransferase domain-containing protein [Candidatus Angelobacter sp.]|jgi:SAM-dependent methyltransferase|nr:methyltransferase domain-containing protein [Candidatus Angelobacter sp.]